MATDLHGALVNSANERDPTQRLTVFLLAGTGIGFLPWFAISALGPSLVSDLGSSPALPGRLVGLLFLAGSVSCLIMGGLVSRYGAAALIRGSFFACGAALLGMALAPSLTLLGLAVVLGGLVLAVPMPATAALVAAQVPLARRGSVIGLAQSGQQVGALSAGAVLPVVAATAGWRWSLAIAAAAAVAAGIIFHSGEVSDAATPRLKVRARTPLWLMAYAFLMSSWTVSAVAYLPVFGADVHGMSNTLAGAIVTVIGGVAIAGKIGWGRVAGRARRSTTPLIVLALVSASGLSVAALAGGLGTWAVWLSAIVAGASALAWPVVTLSLVARVMPAADAGSVAGRILAAGFLGAATGPVVFGWVLEDAGFAPAWWLGVGVTLVATLIVAGAAHVQRIAGDHRPISTDIARDRQDGS